MTLPHFATIITMETPAEYLSFHDSQQRAEKRVDDFILQELVPGRVVPLPANSKDGRKDLASQVRERWTDVDFGGNDNHSLHALNATLAPGYPKEADVTWKRPCYKEAGDSQEYFCENARLFKKIDSGIIQGKLGDGWFLGALAAVACTHPEIIKSSFYNADVYKDLGIYVCRFMVGYLWSYVIIDDRVPVFKCVNGGPCFAQSRDPSELWVCLMEKAFAKLHGSYAALVGGSTDLALRQITGLCTEIYDLKKNLNTPSLWQNLTEVTLKGNVVSGAVQPEPMSSSSISTKSLQGLQLSHNYSILGAAEVRGVRLVMLHNSWSFGEWTGEYGDKSKIRSERDKDIAKGFEMIIKRVQQKTKREISLDAADGTFFMPFDAFVKLFTTVYSCVDVSLGGYALRFSGQFTKETSGGNSLKKTWQKNPTFKFSLENAATRVFIQASLVEAASIEVPFGFAVARIGKGHAVEWPEESKDNSKSSGYTFKKVASLSVILDRGEYAIVPSFYERNVCGKFFITVISTKPLRPLNFSSWDLTSITEQRARSLQAINSDVEKAALDQEFQNDCMFTEIHSQSTDLEALTSDNDRVDEVDDDDKFEEIKDKLLKSAVAHNLSLKYLVESLDNEDTLTRVEFKEQMVALGFGISELPDTDFKVLADTTGLITSAKLAEIFRDELNRRKIYKGDLGAKPEDDIIFRPIAGMPGKLKVQVIEACDLPRPDTNDLQANEPFSGYSALELVHTSGVIKFDVRHKALVRVWRSEGMLVPIALDLRSGLEHGFENLPVVTTSLALNGLERIDWTKYQLCKHELERKDLFANGADMQKLNDKVYLPQRDEYVKEAIARHLDTGKAFPPSGKSLVFPAPDEPTFVSGSTDGLFPSSAVLQQIAGRFQSRQLREAEQARHQHFISLKIPSRHGPLPTTPPWDYVPPKKVGKSGALPTGGSGQNTVDIGLMAEVLEEFLGSAIDAAISTTADLDELLVIPFKSHDEKEDLENLKAKQSATEQVIYERVRKVGGESQLREKELERSKNLREWFAKFDRDGNGRVDQKEFSQALVELGLSVTSKELEVLLSRFDEDGSGVVDYQEFEKFVQNNGQDESQEVERLFTLLKDAKKFNKGDAGRTWSLPCEKNKAKMRDFHSQLVHGALTKSALKVLARWDTTRVLAFMFRSSDEFWKYLNNGADVRGSLKSGKSKIKEALATIASSRGPCTKRSISAQVQTVLKAFPTARGETLPSARAFEETLLACFAKTIVQDETFRSAEEEETRLEEVHRSLNEDYSNGELPIAVQIRLVLACLHVTDAEDRLNPSTMFKLIEDERVGSKVSNKLRLLLREQEVVRRSLKYYIVNVVALRNVHQANCRLKVVLHNTHSTSNALPSLLEFMLPECYQLPQSLLPRVPGLLFFSDPDASSDDWRPATCAAFLDGLVARVVLERDSKSGKIQLGLVESEGFVRALRALLESYDLAIFVSVDNRKLSLMVDIQTLEEAGKDSMLQEQWSAKRMILEMLRKEQNGSLVRGLVQLDAVYNVSRSGAYSVVFKRTGSEGVLAQEQLSFHDFIRHLTDEMNPVVEVALFQGKQSQQQRYVSGTATDGGYHPVFSNACASLRVSNSAESHLGKLVKFRRVCCLQQKYVVLSVYEEQGMYEVVAYDTSSYKEYAVLTQHDKKKPKELKLGKREFDLADEREWDKLLSTATLGDCLTPCIDVAIYSGQERGLLGRAQIPVSVACNDPGREIHRSFALSSSSGISSGKVVLKLRFDPDMVVHPIDTEEKKEEDVFAQFAADAGDEAVQLSTEDLDGADEALMSANDYSLLAQRLRKEVEEATKKLQESETSRSKLMDTCRMHERDLLQTRRDLEQQQEKLLQATNAAEKHPPKRPGRSATKAELAEFNELQDAHRAKLKELSDLRKENERLSKETDARGDQLLNEVSELKSRLKETEATLREEVIAKTELLSQLHEATTAAQTSAQQSVKRAYISQARKKKPSHRHHMERRRAKAQRMRFLKERMGNQYEAYKGALNGSLKSICSVLIKRRPDNPKKPLAGLANILQSAAAENGTIAERDLQDVLLDFGVRLTKHELEIICTHYDVEGNQNVVLDDFVEDLEEILPTLSSRSFLSPAHGSGVQAARNLLGDD